MESNRKYDYPFQNPDLPSEERIDNLLSLMTPEEKINCLGTNPSVPRLGVVGTDHVEGLHGLAMGTPGKWGMWGGKTPLTTTTFPQAYGIGETWDPDMAFEAATIEADEIRYLYHNPAYHRANLVVRAPNADIGRDPRWGRTEECYGEDPFFNATMSIAFVKGLQGDHPRYWKTASLLKHFLANSNEDTRNFSSSDFDERLFHEYYAVAFRRAIIEGGSRAFMAAYNAVNSVPCHINPFLEEIAVKMWGQDGIICTDGGGLHLLVNAHKTFTDVDQAAAAVVKAGICQFLDRFKDPCMRAFENGLMTEADVDYAIRKAFRVMIKLGQLDPPEMVPYTKVDTDTDPWTLDAHKDTVRKVTQKSIVLLKNDNNTLPLAKDKLTKIAVIGRFANEVFCDWYSSEPPYTISALEGIKAAVVNKAEVVFAEDNTDNAAAFAARDADIAIVCVGNHPQGDDVWEKVTKDSYGKEAVDRKIIDLEDEELVRQVHAANRNTVVVLVCNFPYAINWTQENVPAIVHMSHNSQEMGTALADVLFGDYNPAGRLIQTWPKSLDQITDIMDYNIRNGKTYLYFKQEPLYPFGFGLSYTTFAYANLVVADKIDPNALVSVKFDITNTGERSGDEVAQLYVRYLNSKVERPLQQLCGFQRISVDAGETKTVELLLNPEHIAYWDTVGKTFVVEPGEIELRIGASSQDIRLEKRVPVTG